MAKLKSLAETNIVVIYPTLDLRTVDVQAVGKIGELETNTYGNTFLVGNNGVKLIMPQTKIELEIANNRVKIADLYGKAPAESEIVKRYLVSVNNLLTPYKGNIYGFNFVAAIEVSKGTRLLDDKFYTLIKDASLKSQEASMVLQSSDTSYTLKIAKKVDNVYQIVFNREVSGGIEDVNVVQENFQNSYKILEEVIDGI